MSHLQVKPKNTNKSKIPTRPEMEIGNIPCHPASVIFVGKSGSGKTQLLLHLLTDKNLYKDYFDLIFLFSATAGEGCDDLYEKHANIPEQHMFKPDKQGLKQLNHIVETQQKLAKKNGLDKTPKILIIFDDVAHAKKFLASDVYLLLHIANRHYNISTFSLTQSYVKIPRSCRCQVSGIMFFHGGTNSEKIRLSEEHCPDNYTYKEFESIINDATKDKYNFLFVNKQIDNKIRYRKNLTDILELQK